MCVGNFLKLLRSPTKNVKLKQYIPCKRFVEHLVGAERQWAAGRYSSEEWCARGAAATRGRRRKQRWRGTTGTRRCEMARAAGSKAGEEDGRRGVARRRDGTGRILPRRTATGGAVQIWGGAGGLPLRGGDAGDATTAARSAVAGVEVPAAVARRRGRRQGGTASRRQRGVARRLGRGSGGARRWAGT